MQDDEPTLPGNDKANQQRRHERAEIDKLCEIKIGVRNWHQARLRDLTPEGFRLSLTDMPKVGTVLKIRLPGMAMLDAEVCWARNFEAGCKFTNPLSTYVFEHLVRS
ncbi:MAG: PilZ domain-containing protein [Alteraurantiacibacter sp.]